MRALGVTDGAGFEKLMDALAEGGAHGEGGGLAAACLWYVFARVFLPAAQQNQNHDRPTDQTTGAFSAADPDAPPPLLVHPDDAVRRLRQFVEYERSLPSPSASSSSSDGSGGEGTGGGRGAAGAWGRKGAGAAQAKSGVVPRRVAEREREFWARLPQVRALAVCVE